MQRMIVPPKCSSEGKPNDQTNQIHTSPGSLIFFSFLTRVSYFNPHTEPSRLMLCSSRIVLGDMPSETECANSSLMLLS
jgi:hypothetical protein